MAKSKTNNKKKKVTKKKLEQVIETNKNDKSFVPYYFLIALIILIIFGCMYGFRVLKPTNITWIFGGYGDLIQHYVGWEAFRVSDWSIPIGLTDVVSYPMNISVIYTDSIPILAIFFKLISFMLPKSFQYMGLYALICFILQGILSAKIVKRFTSSKASIITISVLFTLVPAMIFRIFYHTALASQWLIILALETLFLYKEFNEGKKIYYMWAILSFLIVSIHFYYIVMCGIILMGYILLDILNTKKIKKSILLLIIYLGVAVLTMWLFGGFTNLTENDPYGFGLFSFNLNGLINPQGWSIVFDRLPMLPDQYEGFAYLGLGVILLVLISIVLTIIWFIKDRELFKRHKNLMISLFFICVVSIFVAMSPEAYIGEHLLYDLELPNFMNDIWAIFRSSGRLVWPVIYVLMLLSVIIIVKRLKWKYALAVLALCTCIQLIDIGGILVENKAFYAQEFSMNEEYDLHKNENLKNAADNEKIKLLVFASEDFYDSDKMIYSEWAIKNGMKTSNFHFARKSFDELLSENTVKYLEEKNESHIFVFTTKRECENNGFNCYELPSKYYLGYVNELN